MRKPLLALAALTLSLGAVAAPAQAAPAPLVAITHATGQAIPGQYIVTLKQNTVSAAAVTADLGARPLHTYTTALNGFSARLTPAQVKALQHNPNVARIEEDGPVTATATQTNPPWGLDRIDQRNLPLSRTYTYNTTAPRVTAYIIDTGLQANHPEFERRASNVYDAFGGSGADCNGHGTHVAGTVGGRIYGVAKQVLLRGVRVLNCSGSGTWSGVISGMDWVARNHVKPAVANMSLGGGSNASVNSAATNMANAGVFTAVAAGNSNADACGFSPAAAANVVTVAASDRYDRKASFSNWGRCVEVYAPGVSIPSAWINSGSNTISGTSMASPHVAGVGALYKGTYGDAPSTTVNSWIINNATPNVISGNPSGTPNRLLYKSTL